MKKSLGQNFLIDEDAILNIVSSVGDISNYDLIEIGPGAGALSKHLYKLEYNKFYLIEKDDRLINDLKSEYKNAHVLNEDAVKVNFNNFLNTKNIIVANLPYYASSKILSNIINSYPKIDVMILMFQKEMADRIVASVNTKDYSRISLMVEEFYKVKVLFDLDPSSFKPAPKVNSTVLKFQKRDKALVNPKNRKKYQAIVDKAFMHRRKKIKYALQICNVDISTFSDEFLNKRAGELSIYDFERIADF